VVSNALAASSPLLGLLARQWHSSNTNDHINARAFARVLIPINHLSRCKGANLGDGVCNLSQRIVLHTPHRAVMFDQQDMALQRFWDQL
jgi:hypothetical protein